MPVSLRLYRLLLKLYPASFRENYGSPLQRQFKDEYADARSVPDLARLWARTLLDVGRSLPAQLVREIGQDSRHAVRLWRRRPLQTAFTIAVLAIAIGANTGVFSVLNAVLLRSLPFAEPTRLALMRMSSPPARSAAEFHAWRQQSRYLADAALYSSLEVNIDEGREAARLRLTETSWNFFSLLGTQTVLGRAFAPDEDTPGRGAVAVIGHGLWQQRFGGDPRAVGATIRLNGAPLTIVGIAPPGFDYPLNTAVWSPTLFDFPLVPKTGVIFRIHIGRLNPALTWAQARHAFETEAYERAPDRRTADAANRPALIPLQEELAGPVRSASLVLMAGVALLLLLACANIANFVLARTLSRSNELMIRTALGASRARLTQQLLTETALLSLIATMAGLLVAAWTTRLATSVQPAQLSSQTYSVLDWRVLSFAIVLGVATGFVFGVAPALYATRGNVVTSGRTATATTSQWRARHALVAAQVAITIVLLAGSFALGRAFVGLLRVDPGYEVRSIATMSVSFAGTEYADRDRFNLYYADVLRRLQDVPGVTAASATEFLPLAIDGYMGGRFTVNHAGPLTFTTVVPVAPDYFRTIGTQLLFGREFSPQDRNSSEPIAVVNEEFARLFGEPSAAVGQSVTAEGSSTRRIIGVARGIRDSGPVYTPRPQIFVLSRSPQALTMVVRVTGNARDRIAVVRDAVAAVDPSVPVFNVKTMSDRLDAVLVRPKFYATAVVFFGGLALLLAIIGVYGVVAHSVGERTREMGIRLALGTTPGSLRGAVLRQTLIVVFCGAVPGVAIALWMTRYFQDLIRSADAQMIATSLVAMITTIAVAAVSIWLATRRVARLDIMQVLRPDDGA
jgi:putative ABC transport system permease protein